MRKEAIEKILRMKGKEKISVLTCYDYSFAMAIEGNADIILVGDSLGNVVLGYERTANVSMEDMLRHLRAVRRGAKNSLIVADMPFGSYENSKDAIQSAKKLIENGADAVKPEGMPGIVKELNKEGIEVMAHLGLLPQSAKKFSLVGKLQDDAERILREAKEMEKNGAFSIVLESIPAALASEITRKISIPTIGIGAGRECDGQVLVLYDMLGLYPNFKPKFARSYMNLKEDIRKAAADFSRDVKKGNFPDDKETLG
ncbi:3-methyl-2-oxobutanoate hydroxymethyltransferase [Candidatus Woesearchaeota archaeon]|nr:3-methyl-2-oxobutanoate hydroxymethyltransferase [Candidatus Woesearchaeota archaeon]